MKPTRKPGRPPTKAGPRKAVLRITLHEHEAKALRKAAGYRPLAEWSRTALLAEAQRQSPGS